MGIKAGDRARCVVSVLSAKGTQGTLVDMQDMTDESCMSVLGALRIAHTHLPQNPTPVASPRSWHKHASARSSVRRCGFGWSGRSPGTHI